MATAITLSELMARRELIEAVNVREKAVQVDMPTDVMAWFGGLALAVADAWNRGHYTITDAELRAGKGEPVEREDDWSRAISALCSARQSMHLLLRTEEPSTFVVNQPGLDALWKTKLAPALVMFWSRKDLSSIRLPSGDEEQKWCEWLRALNSRLRMKH